MSWGRVQESPDLLQWLLGQSAPPPEVAANEVSSLPRPAPVVHHRDTLGVPCVHFECAMGVHVLASSVACRGFAMKRQLSWEGQHSLPQMDVYSAAHSNRFCTQHATVLCSLVSRLAAWQAEHCLVLCCCVLSTVQVFQAIRLEVTDRLSEHSHPDTKAVPGAAWVKGWGDIGGSSAERKPGLPPGGNQ